MNKYTTKLMKILFTQEELEDGYIIEGKSSSKRKALDEERVELLKQAIKIKFEIDDLEWEKTWYEMKKVACGTCSAATKNKKKQKQ